MSTVVCGRYAPGSSFDATSFGDLVGDVEVESLEWQGPVLCVTFAGDLGDDAAAAVRLRIVAPTRADEDVRASLLAAAHTLAGAYPDDPTPALLRDALEHIFRPAIQEAP